MMQPDAIHQHARGQGIVLAGNGPGEFKPAARFGEEKTLGNLLHAVVRAGYASPSQYVESEGTLSPDRRAQASVDGLLDKMKQFTQTDYLVLQQALVKKSDELDPKGKRVAQG